MGLLKKKVLQQIRGKNCSIRIRLVKKSNRLVLLIVFPTVFPTQVSEPLNLQKSSTTRNLLKGWNPRICRTWTKNQTTSRQNIFLGLTHQRILHRTRISWICPFKKKLHHHSLCGFFNHSNDRWMVIQQSDYLTQT